MKLTPLLATALVLGTVGGTACAPAKDAPNNGVDDVKKACEIRATWTKASAEKCVNCVASAPSPACECELFKEFGGKCEPQNAARLANGSCTPPVDCTRNCAKNDCLCVDACYAAAEECKRLSAATDGCVTEVCAPYCN